MFRKTAKYLFTLFILITILFWFPRSILPVAMEESDQDNFAEYNSMNENEDRLKEWKDSPEVLMLKLKQLDEINRSRKKFRASPVKLDILASRVANKMCREAGENDYVGHWNMAGEKPYHRYAFAGGYDHVSENAFGEWTTGNYLISPSTISSMMISGHASFMAEKSPYDGHKKNIINKSHNFVGLGVYLSNNQFRYYEEFIDRYFEFEKIPSEVKTGDQFSITFKPGAEKFPFFMIVYFENFPQAMKPAQIKRKGSYQDFTDDIYLKMAAWDFTKYKNGSAYTLPLKFNKEGLYYIHLYYDMKEYIKPTSINTNNKTPVSGIVIKAVR